MSRGACVPRSVVRPSAAFDRGPVVLRSRVDRRESASGLGSRVPWRDVASWAGRSASSGLSGILSCRPRGDLVSTPRGTQTRRAPDSARRVFVRRMIRPASKGCQTSDARAREDGRRSALDQRTGYPQTPGYVHTGWPVRPKDAMHRYSPGVSQNCLAGPNEPVLSSPDLRRRERWRSTPGNPPKPPNQRATPGASGNSETFATPHSGRPELDGRHHPRSPRHRRIRSNEWTRSRSGEPPWVSCRFPCRPPITRRGSATPSSSMSTTSGSRSRSRTASPRTGSRPATGR